MSDKNITLKNANVVTPDGVVSKGIIDVENGRPNDQDDQPQES